MFVIFFMFFSWSLFVVFVVWLFSFFFRVSIFSFLDSVSNFILSFLFFFFIIWSFFCSLRWMRIVVVFSFVVCNCLLSLVMWCWSLNFLDFNFLDFLVIVLWILFFCFLRVWRSCFMYFLSALFSWLIWFFSEVFFFDVVLSSCFSEVILVLVCF